MGTVTTLETTKLPRVIVSERYPKFTSPFWKHFCRKVRTKLTLHGLPSPKRLANGAHEWSLEQKFEENFVSAEQRDWADYVGLAELQCSHTLNNQAVAFQGGLWSGSTPIC